MEQKVAALVHNDKAGRVEQNHRGNPGGKGPRHDSCQRRPCRGGTTGTARASRNNPRYGSGRFLSHSSARSLGRLRNEAANPGSMSSRLSSTGLLSAGSAQADLLSTAASSWRYVCASGVLDSGHAPSEGHHWPTRVGLKGAQHR